MPIRDYSLKPLDFRPSIFQAIAVEKKPVDTQGLVRGAEAQKQNWAIAKQQYDAINESYNKIRSQVDESEWAALEEREAATRNRLNSMIEAGNTGSAFRAAVDESRMLTEDSILRNKIAINQKRQAAKTTAAKLNNDPLAIKRWEKLNNYGLGNTDTGTWDELIPMQRKFDMEDMVSAVLKQTSPENTGSTSTSKAGDIYFDNKGNVTDNENDAVGIHSTYNNSDSYSKQELSYDKLKQTFDVLLKNPEYRLPLVQHFESIVYGYEDLIEKANDTSLSLEAREAAKLEADKLAKTICDSNGKIYTKNEFETWANHNIEPRLQQLSYKTVNTNKSRSSHLNDTKLKSNIGKIEAKLTEVTENVTVSGTPLRMTGTFINKQWSKEDALSIGNMIK